MKKYLGASNNCFPLNFGLNLSETEFLVFAIKKVFFSFFVIIFWGNRQKPIDKSFLVIMSKNKHVKNIQNEVMIVPITDI